MLIHFVEHVASILEIKINVRYNQSVKVYLLGCKRWMKRDENETVGKFK